jgi:hypothetical protein
MPEYKGARRPASGGASVLAMPACFSLSVGLRERNVVARRAATDWKLSGCQIQIADFSIKALRHAEHVIRFCMGG